MPDLVKDLTTMRTNDGGVFQVLFAWNGSDDLATGNENPFDLFQCLSHNLGRQMFENFRNNYDIKAACFERNSFEPPRNKTSNLFGRMVA